MMELSGRNLIPGVVDRVHCGDVVSEVVLEYEGGEITAVITTNSVRRLRLKPGVCATALVKATDVMIIRE